MYSDRVSASDPNCAYLRLTSTTYIIHVHTDMREVSAQVYAELGQRVQQRGAVALSLADIAPNLHQMHATPVCVPGLSSLDEYVVEGVGKVWCVILMYGAVGRNR